MISAAAIPLAARQAGPPTAFEVTPYVETPTIPAGATLRVAARLRIPPGMHAQSNKPRDPSYIAMRLTIDPPAGITYVDNVYPSPMDFKLKGLEDLLSVFEGDVLIGARLAISANDAPGSVTVPGHIRYQACTESSCLPPRTVDTSWTFTITPGGAEPRPQHADVFSRIDFGRSEAVAAAPAPAPATASASPPGASASEAVALLDRFDVLGFEGGLGYVNAADFLQALHDAERGVKSKGAFEGHGPAAIIGLVFVGGLALNLTPCVLPMIPINLAIIGAGAQGGRRRRGFLLGAAYGGAMAIAYGVLGLVVVLTAGTFGTINASPWFNAAIALLFVWLALAMFDVVSLDPSRWSSRIRFRESSRGTFLLAFGMGTVAAVLAGACVAPVVIQVMIFASELYAGGTHAALALPFVLGLGMAIPWPVAGAGFAALPKPGRWMIRVKQAFGVFILAMAAYYGYVAYGIFADRSVDPASVRESAEAQVRSGWHADLAEGLGVALRDRTPVIIDLWATWCKNCLAMDKTTMADPAVVRALAGYTRIKLQSEDTSESPARDLLHRINAYGLPAYVVLRPKP